MRTFQNKCKLSITKVTRLYDSHILKASAQTYLQIKSYDFKRLAAAAKKKIQGVKISPRQKKKDNKLYFFKSSKGQKKTMKTDQVIATQPQGNKGKHETQR